MPATTKIATAWPGAAPSCSPVGPADERHSFLWPLPSNAAVFECAPRAARSGGLLLVRNFITRRELAALTDMLERTVVRQVAREKRHGNYLASYGALNSQLDDGIAFDDALGVAESRIAHWKNALLRNSSRHPSIVSRLAALPGKSPGMPAKVSTLACVSQLIRSLSLAQWNKCLARNLRAGKGGAWEVLQVAATGSYHWKSRGKEMAHHDRNKIATRYLTALVYLGRSLVGGGYTVFPMLGGEPAATREAASARAFLRERIAKFAGTKYVLSDAESREAAHTLCEEVRLAAERREPLPCLAVQPVPGNAAVFWHFGQPSGAADGDASSLDGKPVALGSTAGMPLEVSNFHIPCGVTNGTKVAFQSFREIEDPEISRTVLEHSRFMAPSDTVGATRDRRPGRGG